MEIWRRVVRLLVDRHPELRRTSAPPVTLEDNDWHGVLNEPAQERVTDAGNGPPRSSSQRRWSRSGKRSQRDAADVRSAQAPATVVRGSRESEYGAVGSEL